MDWRESSSVVPARFLGGLVLRSGDMFSILDIVVGRIAVVIGVEVPVTVGEEFIVVVVVVVVIVVDIPRLLLSPIISISRRITIAAILVINSAILILKWTSLSIIMDDPFMLNWGQGS